MKNLYFGLLLVCLFLSARYSWHRSSYREEFAVNCDEFGYLHQGKEFRESWKKGKFWPDLALRDPQMTQLISHFKSSGLPIQEWKDTVAPHSYHYEARPNQVIEQFPPGNGMVLGLFPEGKAISYLNRVVIGTLGVIGLLALYFCWRKRMPVSAGLIIFAAHEGFVLLDRIQDRSYSINIGYLFLVASAALFVLTRELSSTQKKLNAARFSSFFLGLCLGFLVLIRPTNLFLATGSIFLLSWSLIPLVGAGILFSGIGPLLFHHFTMTGNPLKSTYDVLDTTVFGFSTLWKNMDWYLLTGSGAKHNWPIYVFVLVYLGLRDPRKELRSLALFSASTLGIFLAFYLYYPVLAHYYVYPAIILTVWVFAWGIFRLEWKGQIERKNGFAWAPSFILLIWSFFLISSTPQYSKTLHPTQIPEELMDPKAWILADHLSTSLWYYGHKGSIRILTSSEKAKALIWDFLKHQEGPTFIVVDDQQHPEFLPYFRQARIPFAQAGEVFGTPYYRVEGWR